MEGKPAFAMPLKVLAPRKI